MKSVVYCCIQILCLSKHLQTYPNSQSTQDSKIHVNIPTSSSHALVGGLVGAGLVAIGIGSINPIGVEKVVVFMVLSPIIGMLAAFILTTLVIRAFYRVAPSKINIYFKRLQLFSAFFYSVTHGTNDAQKTMGIITVLLVAYGSLTTFNVPYG